MRELKKRIEECTSIHEACLVEMEETVQRLNAVACEVSLDSIAIPIEIDEDEEPSLVHHIEVVKEKVRV